MIGNRKDKIVILSIIVVVFLFLFSTRTITSGFHFVDDHEIVSIKNDLKSLSVTDVCRKWIQEDMASIKRFRPLYFIHRVFETELFGADFFLWSLYTGIQCIIALIFFYLAMRNMEFSILESTGFLIIAFVGPQSSVWWRLGPNETIGMVFLSLSFFFMTKCIVKRNYTLNSFLFIFFLILSSLCKESFVIIIPGMICLKIWIEKNRTWMTLKESIYKNIFLGLLLIVLAIELHIIINYVGTDYSGLQSDIGSSIKDLTATLLRFVRTYLNLVITGVVLFILSIYRKIRIFRCDPLSITFFLLIVIPNFILYAKSGLVERYLLPSTVGIGFLIISCIKRIDDNTGWFRQVASTLIIISFLPFLVNSINAALKFAKDGRDTGQLLAAISSNYSNGGRVLLVVDPVYSYEKSVSLKTYLLYEKNIKLFGFGLAKDENSATDKGFIDGWKLYFEGSQSENLPSPPEILVFLDKQMIDKFFLTSKFIQKDYLPVIIGESSFALFKKQG